MFIRGSRIITQLMERSTLPQLTDNITRAFPATRRRQHIVHEVQITAMSMTPFVGMKMLHVKAVTMSRGNRYECSLQLNGVNYAPADDNSITIMGSDNKEYTLEPVTLNDHNAKVRCTCLDFFHRFAQNNNRDQSLVGRAPRPYQRVTTDRPSVNPTRVPGLCKHLLRVVERLESDGVIIT